VNEPVVYRSSQNGYFWFGILAMGLAGIIAWSLAHDVMAVGWSGLWPAEQGLRDQLGSVLRIPAIPLFAYGVFRACREFIQLETGKRYLAIHEDRIEEHWPTKCNIYTFSQMSEVWLISTRFTTVLGLNPAGPRPSGMDWKCECLTGSYGLAPQDLRDQINMRRAEYRRANRLDG
jgi:hypothetical protein